MRAVIAGCFLLLGMNWQSEAQNKTAPHQQPTAITLPASVLRNYDVLVDFPQHHFTIGSPGTIHFRGASAKVRVTENGLIQVPSQIENKKYNLALDLGSSISFLSDELFDKLASSH